MNQIISKPAVMLNFLNSFKYSKTIDSKDIYKILRFLQIIETAVSFGLCKVFQCTIHMERGLPNSPQRVNCSTRKLEFFLLNFVCLIVTYVIYNLVNDYKVLSEKHGPIKPHNMV